MKENSSSEKNRPQNKPERTTQRPPVKESETRKSTRTTGTGPRKK